MNRVLANLTSTTRQLKTERKAIRMLVLTRKAGERIQIGNNIVVTVVRIQGDKIRIGIEAPLDVVVHREEVHQRLIAESNASKKPL